MNDPGKKTIGRKQKVVNEMTEYCFTFLYLAFFLGAIAWYRRLILMEYHISYLHYGFAIVEALILAKVILVGNALHLGRELENKRLIYSTIYKAVVFTIFVAVFGVIEHAIEGWLHGNGLVGGLKEFMDTGRDELLARCLITFFAFIPFFGFQEIGRVMGAGKIGELFFKRSHA
ncbi:hypothetical protein [Pedosphaera parvula]|uniref:Uncharacterized protein n=1 Tax=Pedosphaera parvula (strain Ellin514) TaxID=320771 RepID=B9XG34_PEDPL|nr:hypothetical protein [Pedosphaera parvula]EEF61196.1 conserved hypothetical protein [Pedosphaera parvula Ellin514]